nr:two-component system regulatory protein YycI [Evansella caseinilytica]
MDWSRTKSIFIVTFLMLNIFLTYQLTEKLTAGDLKLLTQGTIHDTLAEHDIVLAFTDPEQIRTDSPITGALRAFTEEDTAELWNGQHIEIQNDTVIYSVLDAPYQLPEQNIEAGIDFFLDNYVLNGNEYQLAIVDYEKGRIGLFQTYNGNAVEYAEGRYPLLLDLTEDMQIEAYHQFYMDMTQHGREQEMLTPLRAIEALFEEQLIPVNTVIEEVEPVYYGLLELNGDFQIFGPMWKVHVNDKHYYVNAINGAIQPTNEVE